jgi:hypothetical protein
MPLFKNFDGMKRRMGNGFVEGGSGEKRAKKKPAPELAK